MRPSGRRGARLLEQPPRCWRGVRIGRANLDGTGVDQNFILVRTNEFFDYPCGVAVDGEHVYWAWLNSVLEGVGSIGRANLDGTAVDQDFIP